MGMKNFVGILYTMTPHLSLCMSLRLPHSPQPLLIMQMYTSKEQADRSTPKAKITSIELQNRPSLISLISKTETGHALWLEEGSFS